MVFLIATVDPIDRQENNTKIQMRNFSACHFDKPWKYIGGEVTLWIQFAPLPYLQIDINNFQIHHIDLMNHIGENVDSHTSVDFSDW